MRKLARAALVAAGLATAPAAFAGEVFVNGQLGRIEVDSDGFDEDGGFAQASVGYRWGIGYASAGLEAGLGKLDDQEEGLRSDYTGGFVDHDYRLSSRYGFVGANARIKPPALPVYFIGRAGVLALHRTLDDTATDNRVGAPPVTEQRAFKETDGGTYYGAGVGTTLLPLLDIGLMYTRYRYAQVGYDPIADEFSLSGDKRDASSVSLTVEYRF